MQMCPAVTSLVRGRMWCGVGVVPIGGRNWRAVKHPHGLKHGRRAADNPRGVAQGGNRCLCKEIPHG